MVLPIVSYGHPVLCGKAQPVMEGHPGLRQLIDDMLTTMHAAGGIGLAAPQVAQPYRLFVTGNFGGKSDDDRGRVFINPEIVAYAGLYKSEIEGCLSIPGLQVSVLRYEHIRVRYQNLQFQWFEKDFSNVPARVIQHENDHLDGILMTDRISATRQKSVKPFLKDIAKGNVQTNYEMVY